MSPTPGPGDGGSRGRVGLVWVAGLLVATGAGVATAHGLFEVALAARVPRVLAWLYPLITDGLALVAYAATTRLTEQARRYAWGVVVVAAGLSGLTQAGYLAGGVTSAPAVLRFAIGAWPALAAAIVAHLLYLLGTEHPTPARPPGAADAAGTTPLDAGDAPLAPRVMRGAGVTLAAPRVGLAGGGDEVLTARPGVQGDPPPAAPATPAVPVSSGHVVHTLNTRLNTAPHVEQHAEPPPEAARRGAGRVYTTPAEDRAAAVAREHAARHGRLPTVTELTALARVARGTAASALKDLRHRQVKGQGEKPATTATKPRKHPPEAKPRAPTPTTTTTQHSPEQDPLNVISHETSTTPELKDPQPETSKINNQNSPQQDPLANSEELKIKN